VDCIECGALLPPTAAYCPKCGTSRVGSRREPEDIDEVKAGRRRVFLTGFACLMLGLLVGRGFDWIDFNATGSRSWSWGGPPGANVRPPVAANAEELFTTYRDNRGAAQIRFSRRPLMVTGAVTRIDPHPQFGPDILLKTSDPNKPLRADLVPESREAAFALEAGQTVTVGCQRVEENIGPDPWLRNCRIQEAGEALPATSEQAPANRATPESS
jgi:hypothetical protein